MPFRNILGSLQETGGVLIKRGTAMGPLVPTLIMSVALLVFAKLFESTLVIKDVPLITVLCVLVALWLIFNYTRHYGRFAKHDPDRLQSEKYRSETMRMKMMIAAKELPQPVSADELPLADPAPNLPEPEVSVQEEGSLTSNDIDEE